MIIDTHAHIGSLLNFRMTVGQVLRSMERFGIDFSLVSNIEGAETDHQGNPVPPEYSVPQNELLRKTLAATACAPDKIGVLPWMRIRNELPDKEFKKLIDENRSRIFGLKLHPFHARVAPDEERLEPVYRLAAEYDLPVVSHTGGCEEAMSPHLYNAAKRSICSANCPTSTATPPGYPSPPPLKPSAAGELKKCSLAPTIPSTARKPCCTTPSASVRSISNTSTS